MKISKTLKNQINSFINQGKSITEIINFLFTCDYSPEKVFSILLKEFKCNKYSLYDVFRRDFGMGFIDVK